MPDLAIEVASPTSADEIAEKLDDYYRVGVRSVWVVYPRQFMVNAYRSRTEIRVLAPGDHVRSAGQALHERHLDPIACQVTPHTKSRVGHVRGKALG